MKIAIIGGAGIVGQAWYKVLVSNHEVKIVDPRWHAPVAMEETANCSFILLTLPTPTVGFQRIESIHLALTDLTELKYKGIVVIKSTILPHSIEMLIETYNHLHIIYHPDFLLESDPYNSLITQTFHIVGGFSENDKVAWGQELFYLFKYAKVHYTLPHAAAFVKYAINILLASKVTICNELYAAAEKECLDWDRLVELIQLDPRIGSSHMSVPGPDGRFGFGGSCFPKDMEAFAWEYQNTFFNMIRNRNEQIRNRNS